LKNKVMFRTWYKMFKKIILFPPIAVDYLKFRSLNVKRRLAASLKDIYPCPFDKTFGTNFDRHYIYHTAWAARVLAQVRPVRHVDIGSSLYFAGVGSAFVPIDFYDFRPAKIELPCLQCGQADLLKLSFSDGSIKSLSCMHVVEHVGLGRYGDKIDPEGDVKAIGELKRVLAPGGSLLFVVPVGKPKIAFNAHRIYGYGQVVEYFKDLTLKEFVLIPEKNGGPIYNASAERVRDEDYGCGCFWFTK